MPQLPVVQLGMLDVRVGGQGTCVWVGQEELMLDEGEEGQRSSALQALLWLLSHSYVSCPPLLLRFHFKAAVPTMGKSIGRLVSCVPDPLSMTPQQHQHGYKMSKCGVPKSHSDFHLYL